jgi:TolB-like protein
VRSRRHSNFLRYIVETTLAGKGDEVKEYVIAAEVYGKSSYDPSADSIVRVEAARLRSKMLEYYATNGRDDPVRIDLPRGTYTPVFITQAHLAEPSEAPAGEDDLTGAAQSEPVRMPPRWNFTRASTTVGCVLLASVITFLMWRVMTKHGTSSIPDAIASIAVLPFVSLDVDERLETFAASLTENVWKAMRHSSTVRISDHRSVLPFETRADSIMSIGEQLQTEAILEGSIRKEKDRLRVAVQVVNTADGYRVWAGTYESEFRNAAVVEVSHLIADSALAGLSGTRVPRSAAANEARQMCRPLLIALDRRGQDNLTMRDPTGERHMTMESVMAAVHGFERAIALDPSYSPAYGGLASAYLVAAGFDARLANKVREAALRGLQVDEELAEAHFALGYHLFLREWDFGAAERELKRALDLNPRDVTAARLYADCSACWETQTQDSPSCAGRSAFCQNRRSLRSRSASYYITPAASASLKPTSDAYAHSIPASHWSSGWRVWLWNSGVCTRRPLPALRNRWSCLLMTPESRRRWGTPTGGWAAATPF